MKKLTTILTIAAMVLAASCNKAEAPVQEEAMTFSVSMPMTKAVTADGSAINKVWYGLYKTDGTLVSNYQPVEFKNGSANCQVVMLRGQSYKIVFVAQYDATYTITPETATVSMPAAPVANSDNYDLFYVVKEVKNYNGEKTDAVVLNRGVALVKFNCSDADWQNATALESVPTHSSVTLKGVPTSFNLLSATYGTEEADVTYTKSEIPAEKFVAAAYCFDPDNNITAAINLYKGESLVSALSVDNVPVESNKQTNISGSIMTGTVDFTISITSGSESPDNVVEL